MEDSERHAGVLRCGARVQRRVIGMQWWEYIIVAGVLLAGVCAFLVLTSFVTRFLSSGPDRTAESMYGNYADSARKQRRYARQHELSWKDKEGTLPGNTIAALPKTRGKTAIHPGGLPSGRAA
jgi:hypothetical protein